MSAGTSSVLPNNTYANPIQELWEPAGGGGGGGSAGVLQIVAGSNVTITPASGEGVVTINASGGGGGGGVTSIVAGTGITASPTTGDVTLTNTGVTSLVAGGGIVLSGATGAVTVTAPAGNVSSAYFGNLLFGGEVRILGFVRIGRMVMATGKFALPGASGSVVANADPAIVAQMPAYSPSGSGMFYDSTVTVTGTAQTTSPYLINATTGGGVGTFRFNWTGADASGPEGFFVYSYPTNA